MAARVPTISPKAKKVFEEAWDKAGKALEGAGAVLRGDADKFTGDIKSKTSWYSTVYSAASADMQVADLLYSALRKWIKEYLEKHVTSELISLADSADSEKLFERVAERYAQLKQLRLFATSIFGYLDNYLARKRSIESITELFDRQFHDAVYQKVKGPLVSAIIRKINYKRDGNRVEMNKLRSSIEIFNSVGTVVHGKNEAEAERCYSEDFESHYLAAIDNFYQKIARMKLEEEGGHYTYVQRAFSWWQNEEALAVDLLRPHSQVKVADALQLVLLSPFMNILIPHPDSGFQVLLQDHKTDDLKHMYDLFKRVPNNEAIKIMGEELRKYVLGRGKEVVSTFCNADPSESASSVDKTYIDTLSHLYKEIGEWLTRFLYGDSILQEGRKSAYKETMAAPLERKEAQGEKENTRKTNASEILASYVDSVMKNEFKDITNPDEELERLEDLATLFSHLTEKDIFQEYYKAKLAKRLLQTTPNEDLEKAFLEKLQRQMGKSFTHKMEGMINDRDATTKMSERFKEDPSSSRLGKVSFNVQILTAGHWPAYKTDSLEGSSSLRECITAFTHFYKKAYATRVLNWIHMLGSATLSISFPKGTKEVNCSTYQASVLSIIDEAGQMTVADLVTNLKLDAKIVKPQIATMFLSKMFPLLGLVDANGEPQPTGRGIADDNILAINKAFTHKTRRFKLPVPSAQAKEGMPTDPELEARRKNQVDACIVRIMKSRRTLHYKELLDAAVTQLVKLFSPQPKMIKARIEDLITRGYLKRQEDDSATFEYLA